LSKVGADLQTPKRHGDHGDHDEDAAPRRRSHGGAPKPHQIAHYTPHSKAILRLGKDLYRRGIIGKNAFPNVEERALQGRLAWDMAIAQEPEVYRAGMSSS
jgi:hypothetical protein